MSARLSRTVCLAGTILTAISVHAAAADVDVTSAPSQLAMASPAAQQGPAIARESLTTEANAGVASVNIGHPTRAAINLSRIKRANLVKNASYRPIGPQLILGVRF
jgi:hypothetical protein